MYQSAETILNAQLDSGERLLWSGQSRGGIRLRGQDVFLIPFSLLWGGFAIFWEFMVLHSVSKAPGPMGVFFPLFGVPFVVIGLYLIFGRFFVDAHARARTFYGVTNERIIIVSGLFSQQTKSLQLRTLTDISLTQRNDGSGTITFGPTFFMNGFFPGGSWPGAGRYAPPSFDQLDGAKNVYDIIRNAQKNTPANPSGR
jgi:Bacterial PH domain